MKAKPAVTAMAVVSAITVDSRHEYWPDDLPYLDVSMNGIVSHRQVTDAYLAQLARGRSGRLATFDEGLAQLHEDVAELIPVR